MKLLHIVGNRPQFIKLSAFLVAANKRSKIKNVILHSGQHYDFEMSRLFFKELNIPKADYNLGAGSGTPGIQTGNILKNLDPILLKEKPNMVIVYGDTNTTLAGALASYKLHFPLAHVEAGVRENIWRPEEINKKIADHCSDFCFCPIKRACSNLEKENIDKEKIFFTGDITYDAFLANGNIAIGNKKIKIPKEDYVLMTMHRAETVDFYERAKGVVDALLEIPFRIIYPIHPRAKKQLIKFNLYEKLEKSNNIDLIKPLGYFEFLKLLLGAKLIITDSGGVTKETFYARKLGIIIDNTSEYNEIFDMGYNTLVGVEKEDILKAVNSTLKKKFILTSAAKKLFGDGRAAEKMISIIEKNN
jgi:UDP-N-acetylglucosamine 2-epimerase (non-hydrolysing)